MLPRSIITAAALTALYAVPGHAGVVINVQQSGNDVVATASGTLNMAALTLFSSCNCGGEVAGTAWGSGDSSALSVGVPGATQSPWTGDITGPFPFSTGPVFVGTSGSGDPVGISHLVGSLTPTVLYTSAGYTSGSPLEGTTTWGNSTISSLDLIPGSYQCTWGTGPTADSLTINIVPEPSTFGLAGLGVAALMIFRRRPLRVRKD
jgi:hypothetical protein